MNFKSGFEIDRARCERKPSSEFDRFYAQSIEISQGRRSLKIQERKRLRAALEQIVVVNGWMDFGDDRLESRVRRSMDNSLVALACNPNGLLLLHRYATKIENAINRKIRELRRE